MLPSDGEIEVGFRHDTAIAGCARPVVADEAVGKQTRMPRRAGLGFRMPAERRQGQARNRLKEIYRPIRAGLRRMELALAALARDRSEFIRPMAQYLLRRQGKRVRAALVLISSWAGRTPSAMAPRLAAILELIHAASLIHDDIVDGAAMRRNQPSLHVIWGNRMSVLMGDYMVVQGLGLLAERFPMSVTAELADAAKRLCEGEIEETDMAYRATMSVERYLRIIGNKTAALMASACVSGAMISGSSRGVCRALSGYGYSLGMAFQLVDDVLDYAGEEGQVGKPLRADLAGGRFTIPVLHIRSVMGEAEGRRLERLLKPSSLSNGGAARVAALVRERGGLAYTERLAKMYVDRAVASLSGLPGVVRGPLEDLAAYALERRN